MKMLKALFKLIKSVLKVIWFWILIKIRDAKKSKN